MVVSYRPNGNKRFDTMTDKEYISHATVIIDGRKLSVDYLVWLQRMGLMETWDIV